MSLEVDKALVYGYNKNIEVGWQQQGSILMPLIRRETQMVEKDYYDRITQTSAVKNTTRHGDTPLISTPHDRREVTMSDWDWADMIDKKDRLRMLADPTSSYVQNALYAMGRAADQVIIDAFEADANTGKEGETAVSFDSNMSIASTYTGIGVAAAPNNLNVAKVRRARTLIKQNNAWPRGATGIALVTATQIESMLQQTEVTSSDYNTVKALAQGDIDTFCGFRFVEIEGMLPYDSGTDVTTCYFFMPTGMLCASAGGFEIDIAPRKDKRNNIQVYVCGTFGSVRMWEEQVVRCYCDESP